MKCKTLYALGQRSLNSHILTTGYPSSWSMWQKQKALVRPKKKVADSPIKWKKGGSGSPVEALAAPHYTALPRGAISSWAAFCHPTPWAATPCVTETGFQDTMKWSLASSTEGVAEQQYLQSCLFLFLFVCLFCFLLDQITLSHQSHMLEIAVK